MNSDIIYSIFQYLTPPNIINCSLVCKLFHKVSNLDHLWKLLFKNKFYNVLKHKHFYKNYKRYSKLNNFILMYINGKPRQYSKFNVNHYFLKNDFTFYNVQLYEIPNEIMLLKHINSLNLINISLSTFPLPILRLTNLTKLSITHNFIECIPTNIKDLINLESLDLSDNRLQTIPDEMCQLSKLKDLFLNDNKLKTIPKGLDNLTRLEQLSISFNDLEHIEMEFKTLSSLHYLDICSKQTELLSDDIIEWLKIKFGFSKKIELFSL